MSDDTDTTQWSLPGGTDLPMDDLKMQMEVYNETILLRGFDGDATWVRTVSADEIANVFTRHLGFSSGLLPQEALWWNQGEPQIPHLDKRKTSLGPATKRAKMFLDQEKRSPTRCSYYEARLTGIPVRAGEGLDGYDGAVWPDDVRGVDASSGFEVIGRAPRETAGERSGLDGQPDDHLADAAELGRRRVGVRP